MNFLELYELEIYENFMTLPGPQTILEKLRTPIIGTESLMNFTTRPRILNRF
ncbi:Protein CBG27081 [Caenorhabditis briggsae]|uniref:Protein CBG27081 n=1 Tax=Caenorhabditis briggsae TaxID=6238 RepID=B6IHF7_CAEBR|nr:Protein CBG27081 [Caenorhabditis briggsae]CAR99337.1 Protein CBG27081 [Caenorhabditis briggsae]